MRIPLQDICAGPKCRFFTNYGEATHTNWYGRETPFIYYFYDKKEIRETEVLHTEIKKGLLSSKEVTSRRKEMMPFYHVVYELFEMLFEQNPYCIPFRSVIAKAPRGGRENDDWYAEKGYLLPLGAPGKTVTNPHSFIPFDDLGKYKEQESQWQDGSKCPSYLAYPVAEVGGQNG